MRLRVRIRRRVLDREIAAGLSPGSDSERSLRAQQLTSAVGRRLVAACLADILKAADERHADPSARMGLDHAEVLAARHELVALIEALRGDRPMAARGVALAGRLSSPLVRAQAGQTVRQAVPRQ